MRFRFLRTFDWPLYIIPLLLVIVGVAVIYTISYIDRGNGLAITQALFALVGLGFMAAFTFIDYRLWRGLIIPLYILGLFLLAIVAFKIFPGILVIGAFGASRWINLGFFNLQPSELFKLILIITLAGFFATNREDLRFWHIMIAIMITALPVALTLKQPDLGTASVLIVILLAMLFAQKLPKLYYLMLGSLGAILLPVGWFLLRDYQKERIFTFFQPERDPLGAGYNVLQSMIAVGSGGITGMGFGEGSQSQLNFLPVAHTDFIFAGLAEITGFIGCLALIALFFVLFIRIIGIARLAKDDFGMYIAIGVAAMLLFQVFVNIGMNIALIPVTGIPLPYLSYGGTSLIVGLMAIGILQSIFLRHKKITF